MACLRSSMDGELGLDAAVVTAAAREAERGGRKLREFLRRVLSLRQRDICWVFVEGDEDISQMTVCVSLGAKREFHDCGRGGAGRGGGSH